MALRQETVRLLIADDVGIGKTVEALMIAKELLERGEVHRMAVLCPPHLAEQWKTELFEKFHINAELILASTARRLDKYCGNRSSSMSSHSSWSRSTISNPKIVATSSFAPVPNL